MEKLINYLSEFEGISERDKKRVRIRELEIISKKCGFIKWLVDNDKIDVDKIKLWSNNSKDYVIYGGGNSIIIELSISDTPIEDLISLLK